MSQVRWNIRFSSVANQDKYRIPRGEAAAFRNAIAVLYDGPQPPGVRPIPNTVNSFEYTRNGYLISFEALVEIQTNRVIYFDWLGAD
ncbi:MAG: hypothetical protein M3Q45_04605 [Chloroflexota bacterium]|nr:hypothetical protein [Chloroflexota bacterium]